MSVLSVKPAEMPLPEAKAHETIPVTHYVFPNPQRQDIEIVAEALVSLHVNGTELVTLACTPVGQKELALGFLLNEAIVDDVSEVGALHVCASGLCVDVWLHHAVRPLARYILTSGCGGGMTFDDLSRTIQPLTSNLSLSVEQLWSHIKILQDASRLYRLSGGVHASGLFKGDQLVAMAEDMGRHNTLDKIRGDCALRGIETRDGVLVTTGRISSEMLNKAGRMGCPIVVSRTSATSLSVQLAHMWNITLAGYARRNQVTIYNGVERLKTRVT